MIFVPSAHKDIDRYYRGTYVKFREHGDKLFYINRVYPDRIEGIMEDLDETGQNREFVVHLYEEHPYEVDYILPNKAAFQYGKRACLLRRIPAQQYQRGLCDKNTQIVSIDKAGSSRASELGFSLLKAFVEKQAYPSLNEAVANKMKNDSTALSSRMVYIPSSRTICADNISVATLSVGTKSISLLHPVFRNEVEAVSKDSVFKVA